MRQAPQQYVVAASCPWMGAWLCLMMQASHIPIDPNMLLEVKARLKVRVEVKIFTCTYINLTIYCITHASSDGFTYIDYHIVFNPLELKPTPVSPLPLVFVNIKPQNEYLNMTSACLCVNVWHRRAVLFATRTEARARLAVIFTSAASLNEDVNTEHIQNCSESHFESI